MQEWTVNVDPASVRALLETEGRFSQRALRATEGKWLSADQWVAVEALPVVRELVTWDRFLSHQAADCLGLDSFVQGSDGNTVLALTNMQRVYYMVFGRAFQTVLQPTIDRVATGDLFMLDQAFVRAALDGAYRRFCTSLNEYRKDPEDNLDTQAKCVTLWQRILIETVFTWEALESWRQVEQRRSSTRGKDSGTKGSRFTAPFGRTQSGVGVSKVAKRLCLAYLMKEYKIGTSKGCLRGTTCPYWHANIKTETAAISSTLTRIRNQSFFGKVVGKHGSELLTAAGAL
jgi:hypothetical protein